MIMSTKFFTNSNDRSLFDKFVGIIQNMKDLYAFHAVVGYFRSSGYFALQPYFKDVKEIKILVGIIMSMKEDKKGTKKQEKQIDKLVFKLYELTDEEIRIVEVEA